ncbi:MAG TPA: type II secretion system F family protein [Burkholderiaceae bacterium]
MNTGAAPLPWQVRADLFTQLATLENAGLPAQQAFATLRIPGKLQTRVATMQRLLVRGVPLARAGRQSALFSDLEASLVEAATQAGSPAPVYARLGEFYTERAAQVRAMKSRMMMPGFVLIVGLFVGQLPQLVAGDISTATFLWHAVRPLLAIALLAYLGRLVYRVQEGGDSELRRAIDTVLMRLPLIGPLTIRRNVRDFFASLGLLLEAGMPILDALPRATATMTLVPARSQFEAIAPGIKAGATLTRMLDSIALLARSNALALVRTGEASGSLPEMLFRIADQETAAINHLHRQLADWLPRIVYGLVATWIAYGILAGHGIGPNLPEELQ